MFVLLEIGKPRLNVFEMFESYFFKELTRQADMDAPLKHLDVIHIFPHLRETTGKK